MSDSSEKFIQKPKAPETPPELVAVNTSDVLTLQAGLAELARDPTHAGETIPVWSNDRPEPVGTLDYTPGNEPPVRVRIGNSRYLIGVGKYRIRLEHLKLLRAYAARPYERRTVEGRPRARLHPEVMRRDHPRVERADPVVELKNLLGSVYGPDEVRTAFTRKSGEKLIALPEAQTQEYTKELETKLRQPHIQELVDYLRRNPGEAKKWSLVLETNVTDDNDPYAINDLRTLLDQDTIEQGIGQLILPADHTIYKDSVFYKSDLLITRQPNWTRATWRLVRTDPIPGSVGRTPDTFKSLLTYYCDTHKLPTLKSHLCKNDVAASHILPAPVEAFYRRMLAVRLRQPGIYPYREWTAYNDDIIARAVIVYQPTEQGIEFKERDILGGPERDAGFTLSLAL